MARTISYDPDAVRRSLLELFWTEGFSAASLSDLEAASGLDRRQLYNGLGDKRAMFLAALDDFQDLAGRRFLAPLEAETAGLDDIRALLRLFVDATDTADGRRGCLICSTSQADIAADPAVRERVDRFFGRIHAAYANALRRAAARGEIFGAAARLGRLAAQLFGAHVSLCVLARAGQPAERLRALAEGALAALE